MRYYSLNSFRLCIDECQNNVHCGRIYSPLCENPISFHDLTHIVLLMDKVFDKNDYPKAYQNKRSFQDVEIEKQKPEIKYPIEQLLQQVGTIASFDIIVVTRQHTSWQGMIKNTDGEILGHFDSDLDLIEMIIKLLE